MLVLSTVALVVSSGCTGGAPQGDASLSGTELARRILIVDTHIDVPYRLREHPADVSRRTEDGHFDAVRAREGGLDAAFMSIYVPARYQDEGGARQVADELIDLVEGVIAAAPDTFAPARSPADVREAARRGLIALPLGIENGAAIEDDLDLLDHFHTRGVRYITLTHSRANLIGDSSYDEERRWHGLSPFGRRVVERMNRLGIMVDISHVTDETARDVLEVTRAPVIASHSSCRALTPGFERNISDDLIRAVAAGGGVIQINFGSAFLKPEAQQASRRAWQEIGRYLEEHHLERGSDEAREFIERYRREHPVPETTVADVVAHIDHVVELVGVDHVGFGSDFDGVGALPRGLEDVSRYPALLQALLDRGYTEDEVRRIAGENLLRVWSEVERVAAELSADSR
ncbi:MAG: membrane dipeptidase [Acidobacteria bacterium]|nr:MAG: membrane dipeptidase [Acidobacteriota bacterium]